MEFFVKRLIFYKRPPLSPSKAHHFCGAPADYLPGAYGTFATAQSGTESGWTDWRAEQVSSLRTLRLMGHVRQDVLSTCDKIVSHDVSDPAGMGG